MNGVDKVEVSLNRGNALVTMKPGNNVNFGQLQHAITKNGFAVNETKVEVAGEIMRSGAHSVLKVSGTNDSYPLSFASEDVRKSLEAAAGNRVLLQGTLPQTKPAKMPAVLMVNAVLQGEDAR